VGYGVRSPYGRYPNGIPKVFIGVHNTKNTVDTDLLLTRMLREDVPKGYLHFNHKFYDGPESFLAGDCFRHTLLIRFPSCFLWACEMVPRQRNVSLLPPSSVPAANGLDHTLNF
jgi:hypothetical protein